MSIHSLRSCTMTRSDDNLPLMGRGPPKMPQVVVQSKFDRLRTPLARFTGRMLHHVRIMHMPGSMGLTAGRLLQHTPTTGQGCGILALSLPSLFNHGPPGSTAASGKQSVVRE